MVASDGLDLVPNTALKTTVLKKTLRQNSKTEAPIFGAQFSLFASL
jgi:hypothetical protein